MPSVVLLYLNRVGAGPLCLEGQCCVMQRCIPYWLMLRSTQMHLWSPHGKSAPVLRPVPNCKMENVAFLFFPYAKFFYFAERELRTRWPSCTAITHRSTAIQRALTVCPHPPKNLMKGTDRVGGLLTHCLAALLRWELLSTMANSIKGPAEHLNAATQCCKWARTDALDRRQVTINTSQGRWFVTHLLVNAHLFGAQFIYLK